MAKTNSALRVSRQQEGFTLIELILVMAITGTLALIAFVGQGSLRSQAQFNAAINKVVASVADARNLALTGVNIAGDGNGSSVSGPWGSCTIINTTGGLPAGPAGGTYTFAGTEWVSDNSIFDVDGSVVKIHYYKAASDVGNACNFDTTHIGMPAPVRVDTSAAPGHQGAKILFIRTDTGGLAICPEDLQKSSRPQFWGGGCGAGEVASLPLTLTYEDDQGHTAQIQIDETGVARRLN